MIVHLSKEGKITNHREGIGQNKFTDCFVFVKYNPTEVLLWHKLQTDLIILMEEMHQNKHYIILCFVGCCVVSGHLTYPC